MVFYKWDFALFKKLGNELFKYLNPWYDPRMNQSGNILFLILIAVALFAALSYAVTTSTRSGSVNAGQEQAALNAAQLIQYGGVIRQTMIRLAIMNGCTDTSFNFVGGGLGGNNPIAPADKTCNLFDKAGGNLPIPTKFSPEMFRPLSDTSVGGTDIGYKLPWFGGNYNIQDTPTAASDLYMTVGDLSKDVCIAINNKMGITNPGNLPPALGLNMQTSVWGFSGVYGSVGSFGFARVDQGCGLSVANYTYYMVLLSR